MALSKIKGTVIADDAINADRIADGTVVASDLLDNTITGAKLATDIAISTSGNITTTGALTSTGIDDNATSTAITIDSSENVGIGTSSPATKLHVSGGTVNTVSLIESTDAYAWLSVKDNSSANSYINSIGASGDNLQIISKDITFRTASAPDVSTATYGTERVRIDSSGNVGIGTSSPSNLLHLTGPANGTALQIANTSDTNGIRINAGVSGLASNSLQFLNQSGDSLLIIDGNSKSTMVGNIGPSGYRASFGDFEVKNQDGANNPGGTLVLSNTDGSILSGQILGNLTFASYDQSGATTTGGVASIRAVASETYGSTSGASLLFYTHPSSANNGTVDGNMLERMRINNSGTLFLGKTVTNVDTDGVSLGTGVSTFSASNDRTITINRNGTDGSLIEFYKDGSSSLNLRTISNGLEFSSGGTPYLNILSGGNIGINQTNPSEKLHVTGNVRANNFTNRTSIAGVDATPTDANDFELGAGYLNLSRDDTAEVNQIQFGKNGTLAAAFSTTSNDLAIKTNGDFERVLFRSDGAVHIGTANLAASDFKYHNAYTDGNVARFHNNTATNPYGIAIDFDLASPDDNSRYFLFCTDSTTIRCRIDSDGDVKNHDNSYGAISDERIKQDIRDSNSQWNDIKAVRVRNFKKKDDVRQYGEDAWEQIGVIAQELETVSPKLIKHSDPTPSDILSDSAFGTLYQEGDEIPEGKNVGDVKEVHQQVKGVSYSVLYMKSIKALQEAMERIETLEAKVQTLENNQP